MWFLPPLCSLQASKWKCATNLRSPKVSINKAAERSVQQRRTCAENDFYYPELFEKPFEKNRKERRKERKGKETNFLLLAWALLGIFCNTTKRRHGCVCIPLFVTPTLRTMMTRLQWLLEPMWFSNYWGRASLSLCKRITRGRGPGRGKHICFARTSSGTHRTISWERTKMNVRERDQRGHGTSDGSTSHIYQGWREEKNIATN